ncbi:hypothetical protein C2S53_018142 [Perilla frutescens var. hirtella]|uniref:Glucose-methanol-choline oxidoreductase N-terminal domain-containing protein n=1 Tax=Perilla frutescens var. hirtella TaxID=608512 RepID=A0AAD4JLA4_PERFH|nr:hypothetical protein C2S53_018142 [Perilla frutescens var. hirtella]
MNSLQDTSGTSAAQMFTSTDGVYNHRARILGGGSAINAGFYTHASSEYVRNVGWDPVLVNESYEWVERKVVFRPRLMQWQTAVRDGLLAAGVLPYNGFTYEHLNGTKIGGSIFDGNGIRHSSADLLEYADPANITVYLYATVHQILFTTSSPGQRSKAEGIVFKDRNGKSHWAYLNSGSGKNEIIVSAGAMGSPQLLMLSGIGPGQKLRELGINVVLEQASVGQGMSELETSLVQVVGISSNIGTYIEAISGLFQLSDQQTGMGFIGEKVAKPFSSGYMEVESRDPNVNPRVTFNYFKDRRDLQSCVGGIKIIKKVVESAPMSQFRQPNSSYDSLMRLMLSLPINMRKKHPNATHSLDQFCRDTVLTIWHFHGGCHVDRVVDRHCRVLGVDSLRVVDGSTFHHSPGTNPQATLMMLGRYMGQKILHQRNSHKGGN